MTHCANTYYLDRYLREQEMADRRFELFIDRVEEIFQGANGFFSELQSLIAESEFNNARDEVIEKFKEWI